jgi:hypothetical protein
VEFGWYPIRPVARKACGDDQRAPTSLIEKLLTDHLKRKDYLGISNEGQGATGKGWTHFG